MTVANPGKNLLATLLLIGLAACSSVKVPRLRSTPAPVQSVSEIDSIQMLLDRGDEAGASKRIKALLKRDPMNVDARVLNDSITRDPKELLGPQSYPYTVQAGDTMTSLAEHFLGNRLKSYQLVRYNGLKAPVTLVSGQVLRIPGEPPRVEPVRRVEPAPRASAPTLAPTPPKPKPVSPKPTAPATNPALARQLRALGLAALNQGNINRALTLLERAAALEPGNPMIARDLQRAQRIAATVHARR